MEHYTPSFRAQLITRRTYNRPLNDEGTVFETWEQTIDRVIGHQRWLWERARGEALKSEQEIELAVLRQLMLDRKAFVSGRVLWLGGTEVAKRRSSSQFNCAHICVETVYDMVDMFWLLLQGCGVGFTPVRGTLTGFMRYIPEIKVIRSTRQGKDGSEHNAESYKDGVWTISIGDSAEAWAKAFGKLLAGKHPAKTLTIDLSNIRPAGQRLKGYGWICSGDGQLAVAIKKIADILNKRAGRLLSLMDILDIGNLIGTVLSSRRSAEIALCDYGDPEWREFAMAKKDCWKNGNDHRQQSNNSLVFRNKPSREQLVEIFQMMQDAGGSEPGFVNAEAALKRAPHFKGVNPCLVGETLVPVPGAGLRRIKDLSTANVFDGNHDTVEVQFKKTAENAEIWEVELSDGSRYRVTAAHQFVTEDGRKVQTTDLVEGQALKMSDIEGCFGTVHDPDRAYIDAWLAADGTWYNSKKNSKLYVYPPKHKYLSSLEEAGCVFGNLDSQQRYAATFLDRVASKSNVPDYVLQGDLETVSAFIRGYTESDGHVGKTVKGWTIQYTCVHRSMLEDLQALLRLLGVYSKITDSNEEGLRSMPDGKGGRQNYHCKQVYRLCVSNPSKFFEYLCPENNKRGPYSIKRTLTVESVIRTKRVEDVYCCGVPTTSSFDLGTIHSGNCGEILLGNKGFCNLVEVDTAKFKDDYDLGDAIKIMARANYRQTCVDLKDGILQESWHLNNKFLRLCGVGLTGLVKSKLDDRQLKELQHIATAAASSMADELGMECPKNTSTVKPSGTLSKCADTTEGAHRPIGRYVFNNVAFSIHDPIVKMAVEAGYRVFYKPGDPSAVLITLPVDFGDVDFTLDSNGKEVNVESAIAQLERYKQLQVNWTQHNTSITIYYDPSEVSGIVDWLMLNWDHYVGVSFLYRTDASKTAEDLGYPYLPQEVVTEETYKSYVASLKAINLDAGNTLEELQDDGCAMGVCPVR